MASLNRVRAGQGPELVILHGLFGDLDNFRTVADELQAEFTVTRMDLPAHGASAAQPVLSFDAMASAVQDTLLEDGIQTCHLLGHSLGGKVAMTLAGQTDGPTLASLIVVDIAPRAYPPHHQPLIDALIALDTDSLHSRRDAHEQLRERIPDEGVRGFLLKGLIRGDAQTFTWRFDLDAIARDYALMCQAPPMAQRVDIPTLFIKGGNSDYIDDSAWQTLQESFPHASLDVLPDTGHWPHAEAPARFLASCRRFLEATDAAAR